MLLCNDEYVNECEFTPPSHINTHFPWDTGWGRGVAAVFDSSLSIDPKPKLDYNLFESLTLSLSQHSQFC